MEPGSRACPLLEQMQTYGEHAPGAPSPRNMAKDCLCRQVMMICEGAGCAPEAQAEQAYLYGAPDSDACPLAHAGHAKHRALQA